MFLLFLNYIFLLRVLFLGQLNRNLGVLLDIRTISVSGCNYSFCSHRHRFSIFIHISISTSFSVSHSITFSWRRANIFIRTNRNLRARRSFRSRWSIRFIACMLRFFHYWRGALVTSLFTFQVHTFSVIITIMRSPAKKINIIFYISWSQSYNLFSKPVHLRLFNQKVS